MKEARSQNSVYSVLSLKEERPTYTYEYVFTSIQMDSLKEYIYYKLRQLSLGGGLEGEILNSAPLFNTWIFFQYSLHEFIPVHVLYTKVDGWVVK